MFSPPCKQAGDHLPTVVSTSQANLYRLLDFSPVKRGLEGTTDASSLVQSQLDQIARRLARVAATYVAQPGPCQPKRLGRHGI